MKSVGTVQGLGSKFEAILRKYGVNSVYLFGSRADGTFSADSDYDLGLVFSNFGHAEHNSYLAATVEVDLAQAIGAEVDVVFLQSAPIDFSFSVIQQGEVLYCIDHDFRTDFEDSVIRDYLDFQPFLNRYYEDLRESVKEGDFYAERRVNQ